MYRGAHRVDAYCRSQGLLNTFGVKLLHYLNNVSVVWHAAGTFSLVVAILAKAPTHQSGSFVFKQFIDNTGGWSERASPFYVVVVGVSRVIPAHPNGY